MNDDIITTSAISCKVVILGESGVGKTSIITRYIKNTYSIDAPPTIGASFASKIINYKEFDKSIKFDV